MPTVSKLLERMPRQLQSFFSKFPPAQFQKYADGPRQSTELFQTPSTTTTAKDETVMRNPFEFALHPVTKLRHNPIYSLRRQAELYKMAARLGMADSLPPLANNRLVYADDKHESGVKKWMRGMVHRKRSIHERNYAKRQEQIAQALAQVDQRLADRKPGRYVRMLKKREQRAPKWY